MKKDVACFKEASLKLINIIESSKKEEGKSTLPAKRQFVTNANALSYSGNKVQLNGLYRFLFREVLDCHIDLEKKPPIEKIQTFRSGDYQKLLRNYPHDADILWQVDEDPMFLFYRLEYMFKTKWAEFYPFHQKAVAERPTENGAPIAYCEDYDTCLEQYRDIENITVLYDIFLPYQVDYINQVIDEFLHDATALIDNTNSAIDARDFSRETHDLITQQLCELDSKYAGEDGKFEEIYSILPGYMTYVFSSCGFYLLMQQLEAQVTDLWLKDSVNYGMEKSDAITEHPFFHIFNTKLYKTRHEKAANFDARSSKSKEELTQISEFIVEHCSNCTQISCKDCPYCFYSTCNTEENIIPDFLS